MRSRKSTAVVAGALVGFMGLGSTALACTDVQGKTDITKVNGVAPSQDPAEVQPGDTVTATADNAEVNDKSGDPITYWLHFLNYHSTTHQPHYTCMGTASNPPGAPVGDERISAAGIQANPDGTIDELDGVIPDLAQTTESGTNNETIDKKIGVAWICHISGDASGPDYLYGTNADSVTVL